MMQRLDADEVAERIRRVRSANGRHRSSFTRLVERAGLDPTQDLRYGNWSGIDFGSCDLRDYDFTGAALHQCKFEGAMIDGAEFQQCEFGIAADLTVTNKGVTFTSCALTDIRRASDWTQALATALARRTTTATRLDCHLKDNAIFRDAIFAPELVVIPKLLTDHLLRPNASGKHMRLAVCRRAISNDEFGVYASHVDDPLYGWRREPDPLRRNTALDAPATDIRQSPVRDYAKWLNDKCGFDNQYGYRLLTDNEYRCILGSDRKSCWHSAEVEFYGGRYEEFSTYTGNESFANDIDYEVGSPAHGFRLARWVDGARQMPERAFK